MFNYSTRTTTETSTQEERCRSPLHTQSTEASASIVFAMNVLPQKLYSAARRQSREMSGVNSHLGVVRTPVRHRIGTVDVIADTGRRQPVDQRRSVPTLVDEVAGEERLASCVVDGDAALRVTWDVDDLQSVRNLKHLTSVSNLNQSKSNYCANLKSINIIHSFTVFCSHNESNCRYINIIENG